jgi:putative membrane protein
MKIATTVSAFVAAAVLVLQASGAGAQQATPMSDQEFVREVAAGNMAEVELGQLASQRASRDAVKQFGQRMVTDHGRASQELSDLARQKGWNVPQSLDAKHQALRDRLASLSGPEFDRAYMDEMVRDHNKDVATFEAYAPRASDAELKAWIEKTLPTLREHRAMAQQIHGQVAAAGTTVVAASPATVVVEARPWCGGAYIPGRGTNFGSCPRDAR